MYSKNSDILKKGYGKVAKAVMTDSRLTLTSKAIYDMSASHGTGRTFVNSICPNPLISDNTSVGFCRKNIKWFKQAIWEDSVCPVG